MDPGPFTDPRVFGPRVPGYPIFVLYGAPRTGVYIHCCALCPYSLQGRSREQRAERYPYLRTTRDTHTIPLPAEADLLYHERRDEPSARDCSL